MRTALTIGHRREGVTELLEGPETPVHEQQKRIKALAASGRANPDFQRVELWESGRGITKTLKFEQPKPATAEPATAADEGEPEEAQQEAAPTPEPAKPANRRR